MLACEKRRDDVAELLTSKGADVNLTNKVHLSYMVCVKLLLIF